MTDHSTRPDSNTPADPGKARPPRAGFFTGVAGQLLLYTVGLVLLAQVLVLPLVVADRRNVWLAGRANVADIGAVAAQSMSDHRFTADISKVFLDRLFILAITADTGAQREIIMAPTQPLKGPIVQMNVPTESPVWSIPDTIGHFLASEDRYLKLHFKPRLTAYDEIEVTVSEATLREILVEQSGAIILNTLVLSALAGAIVYFTVFRIVVRPMQGVTQSVTQFSEAPDAPPPELPYGRSDEIRRVLAALGTMQRTVSSALRQRKRLDDLGEAVAKINHDLRNSLSAAQVLSDGLADSQDPNVRDAAPRLERAIQRAITLAEATLKYGRSEMPLPNLQTLALRPALEEAAMEGITGWSGITCQIDCAADLKIIADAEHIHRIITNLTRNAARAMTGKPASDREKAVMFMARRTGDEVVLLIEDNGPGIPASVGPRLFQPFSKGGSDGGTGLGLAIARELARGMGGDLALRRSDATGATFALSLRAG